MHELWDKDRDFIKTSLVGMRLELPLGIHPWEHDPRRPQLVSLDIDVYWPIPEAFDPHSIHDVVDYEHLRNAVLAWSRHEHTKLMETLIEELFVLCWTDPRVVAARIAMSKLGVFNDVDAAAVEAYRRRPGP